jgi:glycosyltransferase involved in cell wall biosynthesis
MLRVVTFSTLYPNPAQPRFGGFVERQTLHLAHAPGVELRVVAPLGVPPFPLNRLPRYRALRAVPRAETWNGLPVERPRFALLPGVGWRLNPHAIAAAARPVMRRLIAEGFRFDVIDCEFFYPDGPAAVRLGAEFGVPVSIKSRGSDIHYWGKLPAARRAILASGAAAGGMLAVSEALKRDMAALGLDAEKIRVHYTGVDLERFRPRDRDAAKASFGVAGPLVAMVGNLVALKGHELVIRALAELPGASLLVAGDGPERGRLSALIASLGLGERARLLGSVPHERVAEILAAADVVAHPSEREGLANIWVEALASGTPVVSSDVGSAREVIDREAAGMVVPERTPGAFAGAIRALLAREPDVAATRAAAERFTWARNSGELVEHLQALTRR